MQNQKNRVTKKIWLIRLAVVMRNMHSLMASSKVPSTALSCFSRRSAYLMYCFAPEKTRRLVYGPFYLAINVTFYEFINPLAKIQKDRL